MRSIIQAVQKNEPDMQAYQVYLNSEENKCYIVEWFKNSEAVLTHLANVGPMGSGAFCICANNTFRSFWQLTQEAENALKSIGATFFKYFAGFIRGDL